MILLFQLIIKNQLSSQILALNGDSRGRHMYKIQWGVYIALTPSAQKIQLIKEKHIEPFVNWTASTALLFCFKRNSKILLH